MKYYHVAGRVRRFNLQLRFDPRGGAYPVRQLFWPWFRPKSRRWECPVVLDQGNEGACAGFAAAHELAADPVRWEVNFDFAMVIFHKAQEMDEFAGTDYEGTTINGVMRAGRNMGFWKSWRWAFSEMDLRLTISKIGPAVLGILVYEGMLNPDANGLVRPTGEILGAHAILCNEWRESVSFMETPEGVYSLRNSWGETWGKGGDCFITAEDMKFLLSRNGEAAIPIGRLAPPETH